MSTAADSSESQNSSLRHLMILPDEVSDGDEPPLTLESTLS